MSTIISKDPAKNDDLPPNKGDGIYSCKIKNRKKLNRDGSSKTTYHVELNTTGLSLQFKEGDSIAIFPENPSWIIERILKQLNLAESTPITDKKTGIEMPLGLYLTTKANLSRMTSALLKSFITATKDLGVETPLEALFNEDQIALKAEFVKSHDLLSFIEEHPTYKITPQLLCDNLGPLLPRFYSIASSPKAHVDSLHLLVACFTFEVRGSKRHGIGSDFLCKIATLEETPIRFQLYQNLEFSLPHDPNIPIIMIGPGTGLAPFRGFVQHRAHVSSTKNWLFFGERHRNFDFYYEEELSQFVQDGKLVLHTAFSRDQAEKIYVQHRLLEQGQELWNWIEQGAMIYVCGDAKEMSKDVEKAFISIAEQHGFKSNEEAISFIKSLKKSKRYLQDVY